EQLLDAVVQVTGIEEPLRVGPPGLRAVQMPYVKTGSRFLTMFGRPEDRKNACVCIRSQQTTLPQVLHMINGDTVGGKLRSEGGDLNRLLALNLSDERLVEELYLGVLSRLPDDRERRLGRDYLKSSAARAAAAHNITWASAH